MDRLVHTSLSALRGAMARQAATANNLANVNTVGFRGEMAAARALWLRGDGLETRAMAAEEVTGADMRTGSDGSPVITDEGHHLLDCELPSEGDLPALADAIKATVGVVEHGLFLGMASVALLGTPDGDVEVLEPQR